MSVYNRELLIEKIGIEATNSIQALETKLQKLTEYLEVVAIYGSTDWRYAPSAASNLGRVASTTAEPKPESGEPRKPREWTLFDYGDGVTTQPIDGCSYRTIRVREVIE